MDKQQFVTLDDVVVVEATDSALLCCVAGREVWVPLPHVWLARDLGLDHHG